MVLLVCAYKKMENDHLAIRNIPNISYLRARDPSIMSGNRPQLSPIRMNLIDEFSENTQNPQQEQNENIRVYLRIKNGYDLKDLYEINDNILVSKVPPGSNFLRNVKDGDSMKKIYTFSKIFEPQTTQREIFNYVVKPKILDFINGQNSTLLTYGASGSGKTFTVIGTDEEPGVVPRSLEYLFRTLPQLSENPPAKPTPSGEVTMLDATQCRKERMLCRTLLNSSATPVMDKMHHARTYMSMQQRLSSEPVAHLEDHSNVAIGVWVSFAEIYNEQVYDLLQLDPPRGKQRPKLRLGLSNGCAYIKNLTHVNVSSGQEAFEILQHGLHHLNYASTDVNSHSSRSHSIFTIKLVQVSYADNGTCVSCFSFCDLAGSERSKKTRNVGDRLKESNNINSSLLVLGRCISAVREAQKHNDHKLVPFRESKLTQLFQRALAGYEDIAMIVNVSPSKDMFDESQHVLNFSAVAKEITIEIKPEMPVKKNRFSQLLEARNRPQPEQNPLEVEIERLQNAVLCLQDELEQQRIDFEVNEKMNRDYVIQGYQKMLKDLEGRTATRIQDAVNVTKLKYEGKMANLRMDYEKMIRELEAKNGVIEIVSSDDEDSDGHAQLVQENRELQATLEEAVNAYQELQTKCENQEAEIIKLKAQCEELEVQLTVYQQDRTSLIDARSETDSDEQEETNITFNF